MLYIATEATPRNPVVHTKHDKFLRPKTQLSLGLAYKLCVGSLISAIHCRYFILSLIAFVSIMKNLTIILEGEGRVLRQDRKAPCVLKVSHKPERGRHHPGSCWGRKRSPSWDAQAQPARCCSPPRQRAWGHCCGLSQICRHSRRKRVCNLRKQNGPVSVFSAWPMTDP